LLCSGVTWANRSHCALHVTLATVFLPALFPHTSVCSCVHTRVHRVTLTSLFAPPAGKITRLSTVRNGLFMAINGSLAAAAAYLVGWGLMKAVGNSC
jgi:hypothetical protein